MALARVDAIHARGLSFSRRGSFAQALTCFDEALALQPGRIDLQLDRANALQALARRQEALEALDRLLDVDPDHLGALNNRGNLRQDFGRYQEALDDYERAIGLDPHHPLLHNNRGMALRALGREVEARDSYERAMALDPANPRPCYNLANLLYGQPASHAFEVSPAGSLLEAIPLFQRALRLDPALTEAAGNLATVLLELGRVEEAIPVLRDSLNAQLALRCDAGPEAGSLPLPLAWASLLMFSQYLPGADPVALGQEARRWGTQAEVRARLLLGRDLKRPSPDARPHRPLRVGYVSGDLTLHPVGLFLRCVLMAHDPARITPFLYDNGSPDHSLKDRLGQGARLKGGEHRRIEKLDDLALARQIADDRIDILVDLSGHTARSRLEVFALRPAPLQLSWLGYFASTGLAAIDGLILDPVAVSVGSEAQFVESVLRLPYSRFCFQPAPFAPAVAPPPFDTQGFITFGCFNNTSKLNGAVLASWARILRGVPHSRLILQWRTFADPSVVEALRQTMEDLGVAAERLELRPSIASYGDFLHAYADIDLALDPFPFSGGQTSCEALWQGVPVLTLAGSSVVSRQTLTFLRAIDLDGELSAADLEAYEAKAMTLARTPTRLAELRQQLRDRMAASPLCDVKRFTVDLEQLYAGAWEKLLVHCRSGRHRGLDPLGCPPLPGGDPAVAISLQALATRSDAPLPLGEVGEPQNVADHCPDVLPCLKSAPELQNEDADGMFIRGTVLHEQGSIDEAITAYRRAIRLNGTLPSLWMNLGAALAENGQAHAAIEAFQQALRIDPNLAAARSHLAKMLLQTATDPQGWQIAWRAYEWRFINRPELLTVLPGPRWRGEANEAQELVLVAEQGLGDTVQFIRFAPLLRQRFQRLLLHGHGKLADLLLGSGLIDGHRVDPLESGDAPWVPLQSLPAILEVRPDSPVGCHPYLRAEDRLVRRWRRRLGAARGLRVGINWQADPASHERQASRNRSLPLQVLAPLAEVPGIQLVSLQQGFGCEQRAQCSFPQAFVAAQDDVDAVRDFRDTAAILMACDLIISSDSSLAHLAAALGQPTWLLLPRYPEWPWEREGDSTGWYPSMRLFRQSVPGNWDGVIERVRDALSQSVIGAAKRARGRKPLPTSAEPVG